MCYGIDDNEDRLCGFVLTIEESEKYDRYFQQKWIDELQRKYPNIDQVNHSNISQLIFLIFDEFRMIFN